MANRHYRAHQRFVLKLPVVVSSIQRPVSARGSTVDLGIGGSACELDTPLRLGEKVLVTLDHGAMTSSPTADATVLKGEVAWVGWAESSAVRLGVRFDHSETAQLAVVLDALDVVSQVGS